MIIKDVFDSLHTRHSLAKFSRLINDILILEDRLSRFDQQSIYFRWAISNHTFELRKLKRRYDKFRYHFNDYSVDDFLDELNGRKNFLEQVIPGMEAGIIKHIARTESEEIIAETEDMIALKAIIDQLPDLNQLKEMPEWVDRIIESL